MKVTEETKKKVWKLGQLVEEINNRLITWNQERKDLAELSEDIVQLNKEIIHDLKPN